MGRKNSFRGGEGKDNQKSKGIKTVKKNLNLKHLLHIEFIIMDKNNHL